MARIRIVCPAIYGESVFSDLENDGWVRPLGMMSGRNYGFFQLPNKWEAIYIMFEDGNIDFPIWTYGWFAENELPEECKNRFSEVAIWKTRGGQSIFVDDKKGSIEITTQKGGKISIIGEEIKIEGKSLALLNGSQKAVLGNELATFLTKLLTNIALIQTPQGPILNASLFETMKAELNALLSKKITLE